METQVGHTDELMLITWKSPHWKTTLGKTQAETSSTRLDGFTRVKASVATDDKLNFRWFLSCWHTMSLELWRHNSLLVGKAWCPLVTPVRLHAPCTTTWSRRVSSWSGVRAITACPTFWQCLLSSSAITGQEKWGHYLEAAQLWSDRSGVGIQALKCPPRGLPWWSSGWDSRLPLQGA